MFLMFGAGFSFGATQYSIGTAAHMGPGYFPFWTGLLLAALGLIVSLRSLSVHAKGTTLGSPDVAKASLIIASIVLAGFSLNYLGIYITVFLLTVLSSAASHEFSWKTSIINGFCLAVFVVLVFVKGLGLVLPLWPSIFGK